MKTNDMYEELSKEWQMTSEEIQNAIYKEWHKKYHQASSEIAKDKNLNLSPKYWIDKKNQLDKKTKAKMMEYIKNNSTDKLKQVIKKFYKK